MKTAMQELIDEMNLIKNLLWEEGLKDKSAMISDMIKKAVDKLPKEKEQIIETFDNGIYVGTYAVDKDGEQYYRQTYTQKQHIIDIMKADEDDGLYKTFDTDPDKKH
jgi:ketol-acid reductoisomerase